MAELTQEQIQRLIFETLERIESRQGATARSVRILAEGLTTTTHRHQGDIDRLGKVEVALLTLVSEINASKATNFSVITPQELAKVVPKNIIDKARAILRAREQGEPEPLPDVPTELVPVHYHRRKDDSVTIRTDAHGHAVLDAKVRVKTLAGWIVAGLIGAIEAAHLIYEAVHH